MLHVEVDENAALFREPQDWPQTLAELPDRIFRRCRVDLRIERGNLDRHIYLWDRPAIVRVQLPDVRPCIGRIRQ